MLPVRFVAGETKMIYKNYDKYLPINDTKDLRSNVFANLTESERTRWKIFTGLLARTPYMAHLLCNQQGGVCPICQRPISLDKSQIHHKDYKYLCHYDTFLRIAKPAIDRPSRIIKIARCEECSDTSGCTDRISLIHKRCHIYLHAKEGRISRRQDKNDGQVELFDFI
jgi:hypothetical protein